MLLIFWHFFLLCIACMLIWFTLPKTFFKFQLLRSCFGLKALDWEVYYWILNVALMCRALQNNPDLSYIPLLLFSALVLKIHGGLEKHWLILSFLFVCLFVLLWVYKFRHYCSSTIQVIMLLLDTKYRGRLIVWLFTVYFSQEPKEVLDIFLYL